MAFGPLEVVPATAVGTGVGGGISTVIEPLLRDLANQTWQRVQSQPLDPLLAASAFVQGITTEGADAGEASLTGISGGRFATLAELARTAPATGELLTMLRRELIGPGDLEHGLRKASLETRWDAPIAGLEQELVSPADLAMARQQGFENIINLDLEAKHNGVTPERLKLLFELSGLPPGVETALDMWRRKIIDEPTFAQIVREGHTKTKYTGALEQLKRPLVPLATIVNNRLRGWITDADYNSELELHGFSPDDGKLLYQAIGRPPAPGQLQTAVNRGLLTKGAEGGAGLSFYKGIVESDLRPEWVDLLYALRVRYPTAFVLRQLTSSGAITPAEAANILELEGWPADLATKTSKAWASSKTAGAKQLAQSAIESLYESRYLDAGQAGALLTKLGYDDSEITLLLELGDARRVKRFLDTAVGRVHTLFTHYKISEATASSDLDTLGISSTARDDLLAFWRLELEINAPLLTPAQITGAVHYGVITRDEGLAELKSLGYSDTRARILIDTREHGPPAPGQL
jgi:hypothetical protein